MAEAILRHMSRGTIDVQSAGSAPGPEIHPMARQTMARLGIDLGAQHPKSWDRFTGESFDYVITVCDKAAESCPAFPGSSQRVHWSFDDPAAASGTSEERQRGFDSVAKHMMNRIRIWLALPQVGRRTKP
jgi:arsenate reductase